MQSKEFYVAICISSYNIFLYIVNLTNVCRICGSYSDEDDKFWVSYIGRLVATVVYLHIRMYLGTM